MGDMAAAPMGRRNRGPIATRLRDAFVGTDKPPVALGLAVALCLLTVATFGVLLLKELRPGVAFAVLYLIVVVAVAARWGPAVNVTTIVGATIAFGYFSRWPHSNVRFAVGEVVVVFMALLTVGLTTNAVARRGWKYRVQAPEHWASLDRVSREHQIRRLRIGSLFRLGTVLILLCAMFTVSSGEHRVAQSVLLGLYAAASIWAVVMAFSADGPLVFGPQQLLAFALADVAVVFGYQLLAGDWLSLLLLGIVPLIVVPELSWRRAAVVQAISAVAFVAVFLDDAGRVAALGWPRVLFVIALYVGLCGISLVAAYVEERHFAEIAELSISRQALLGSTMTAADVLQRRVAEAIHDGALQDLMAARQEMTDLAALTPSDQLDRALANLGEAATRLREAIFELHPVVVEQLGLGAALEKLAVAVTQRSGIEIVVEVDSDEAHPVDPIVFGAVRELLSNVVRHSQAGCAVVELAVVGDAYVLDVVDDGVGLNREQAAKRLTEGHIGLASHQARIEAAGGTFAVLDADKGTHILIEVPLSQRAMKMPA